ncbi:hypothetical protein ADINL_2611 [Nitrincola lacisaponensis]|uniref:Transmembrane protein n=1 Tax=Nitrincola lacisaponensis TaxID=267850 RepID=A0A063Y4R3_9GAMM|nr:hypothetical protein [Nitrincola lacisaponensis]KDE39482.1 hypothetical protein ADINL_2611 [Nitrincola lacisaponensis]
MLQCQYSESAWTGKQPDCYEPDLSSLPKLPLTPSWLKELNVGLNCLYILVIITVTLSVIATLVLLFSSGFYVDRMLANSAMKPVIIAWLINAALILVTVFLFRIQKKNRDHYDIKYDDLALNFTKSMPLNKWVYSGMIIPTTTMGFMELTPSVWRQRGMADKFGRTFFDWDHIKLTVYDYSTTRFKKWLKVCRRVNFVIFPLFGWSYILQMINEDVFLPPYILLFVLQTLLLFSGRFIYAGENQVKLYEYNRHTGQVSKFDPSGNQLWSYPFSEFNMYVRYEPSDYGPTKRSRSCVPYMIHRYSPHWKVEDIINFYPPWTTHADRQSTKELIDTLIAFMNVKLPLPQCLALQACRHLDSTTQALETPEAGSTIDFLSMSDKEYKDMLFQIWKARQGTY